MSHGQIHNPVGNFNQAVSFSLRFVFHFLAWLTIALRLPCSACPYCFFQFACFLAESAWFVLSTVTCAPTSTPVCSFTAAVGMTVPHGGLLPYTKCAASFFFHTFNVDKPVQMRSYFSKDVGFGLGSHHKLWGWRGTSDSVFQCPVCFNVSTQFSTGEGMQGNSFIYSLNLEPRFTEASWSLS